MLFSAGLPPLLLAGHRSSWRRSWPLVSACLTLAVAFVGLTSLDLVQYWQFYMMGKLPGDFLLFELPPYLLFGKFGRDTLHSAAMILAISSFLTVLVWLSLIVIQDRKQKHP